MGNKIAFVVIYYGQMPGYLSMFLWSAARNPHLDFLFFTDWEDLPVEASNIRNYRLSLLEFNRLAISKGILLTEITNGYKLCDLKPAWFDILEEYIPEQRYDYVGYIDIDMVLGRADEYITERTGSYDVWTIVGGYISGAFTLFRNNEKMRRLYRNSTCWSLIFNDSRHFAFDEDLRPNFRGGEFQSFSDVIAEAEQKDIIKVGRSEDAAFQARPALLQYADGRIFDDSGREFICFHYTVAKSYLLWMLPSWRTLPEKFYVNKFGFFRKRSRPLTLFRMVVNPRYCKELVKNMIRKRERIFSHFRRSNPKMIFTLIKDQF